MKAIFNFRAIGVTPSKNVFCNLWGGGKKMLHGREAVAFRLGCVCSKHGSGCRANGRTLKTKIPVKELLCWRLEKATAEAPPAPAAAQLAGTGTALVGNVARAVPIGDSAVELNSERASPFDLRIRPSCYRQSNADTHSPNGGGVGGFPAHPVHRNKQWADATFLSISDRGGTGRNKSSK